jgi:hypothetical protein
VATVRCQTCSGLATSLGNATDSLALAILQMRTISGMGTLEAFQAVFTRALGLRSECEVLITEIERHEAELHMQQPKSVPC